jgi:hypothetical protein
MDNVVDLSCAILQSLLLLFSRGVGSYGISIRKIKYINIRVVEPMLISSPGLMVIN